jgi:hypothetical protein
VHLSTRLSGAAVSLCSVECVQLYGLTQRLVCAVRSRASARASWCPPAETSHPAAPHCGLWRVDCSPRPWRRPPPPISSIRLGEGRVCLCPGLRLLKSRKHTADGARAVTAPDRSRASGSRALRADRGALHHSASAGCFAARNHSVCSGFCGKEPSLIDRSALNSSVPASTRGRLRGT